MNQEIIFEEYRSKKQYGLLNALCLMLPVILKVLVPSELESKMMLNVLGLYIFLPNMLLFIFLLLAQKNTSSDQLQLLFILEMVVAVLSFLSNSYTGGFIILVSGTFYYYAMILGLFCKISQEEKRWIGILAAITVVLLDIEVVLFATGALHSYNNNEITGQLYGDYYRINTTVGAATGTACIIYLLTFISVLLVDDRRIRVSIFILSSIATLMTVSRGAIIALGVYFLLFALQLLIGSERKKVRYIFLVIIVVVVMSQLGFFDAVYHRNTDMITSSYGLLSGRETHIETTIELFKQNGNFLFGCGVSNVFPSNELIYALGNSVQLSYFNAPHNTFILFLAEQGWAGVILFVAFWLGVLKDVWKEKSILYGLLPVILVLFNTETVVAVDSEYMLLLSIIIMLGLDHQKRFNLHTL